jgi:hypothetical protein
LARKKEHKKKKRSTSSLKVYRDHPYLRGKLHSEHPFVCCLATETWNSDSWIDPLGVAFAREIEGQFILFIALGDRISGMTEFTGYFYEDGDKDFHIERVRRFLEDTFPGTSIRSVTEEEGIELIRVSIASIGGASSLSADTREWVKMVHRDLVADSSLQRKYTVLFKDRQDISLSKEYLQFQSSEMSKFVWRKSAIGRWLPENVWNEYWAQRVREGVLDLDTKEFADLGIVYLGIAQSQQAIAETLEILPSITEESPLKDVSVADVWLAMDRHPALDSIELKLHVMHTLEKLVDFEFKGCPEGEMARIAHEHLLLTSRMLDEERAGVSEDESVLFEMLFCDLGYHVLERAKSLVRPGTTLPIFQFFLYIHSYVRGFDGDRQAAMDALDRNVPDAETKLQLMRLAFNTVSETGYDIDQAIGEENLEDRFTQWWTFGRLTKGMAALVGRKPEPLPEISVEELTSELNESGVFSEENPEENSEENPEI